mmetsp:Transcript_129461/g.228017  ORF Transcript_129461/g.228017 Transcript_129461/m.228017 type:complete len:197 (+) Transcript_129461:67-657(+)
MEPMADDHCESKRTGTPGLHPGTPLRSAHADTTFLASRSRREMGAKKLDMVPALSPIRIRSEGLGLCHSTPGKRAPSASPLIATPLRAQRRRLAAASVRRAVTPRALKMAPTSSSCDGPVVCWFTVDGELRDFAAPEPQEPPQLSPLEDLAAADVLAEPVLEISLGGPSAAGEGVTDPRRQSRASTSECPGPSLPC